MDDPHFGYITKMTKETKYTSICKNYIGKELLQTELIKNIKKKPTNLTILLA
jgi:hypothetical protein